jgi:hypothetical protein
MTGDSDELALSRAYHAIDVRKRLTQLDLDEVSFFEHGTVKVEITIDGKARLVNFSIKSISDDMMRKLAAPLTQLNSRMPTRIDVQVDEETGRRTQTRVHDETHPEYEAIALRFIEANRLYEFKKLLHGLDMKLEYKGRVLWNPYDEEEQDYEASIARLNAIGIRTSDIKKIVTAIDKLSNKTIEEDQEEFQKK